MRKPTRPLARRIDERKPAPYQQRSPEPVFCNEHARCQGCPYPRHGIVCWHRDGTCLRTDTKNAADLVAYVTNAWQSGWGYVWGTYGQVLTPELFQYKLTQYPEGVGQYADFIRSNWLGKHTADCVGLIKGYGWLSPDTMTIDYGSNGMPDIGANQMYYNATRKGTIDTIPEVPGLAVWKSGHIGVYVGNGQVIEAMGTRYGVVKTQLQGRGWTHWLEIPYINYD